MSMWKLCHGCTAEEAKTKCMESNHCDAIASPDKQEKKGWHAVQMKCVDDTYEEDDRFIMEFCLHDKHDWTTCILDEKIKIGCDQAHELLGR